MTVNEITVKDHRNLEDGVFRFSDGINVICGDNAQGKTNLIEAVWMFTGQRSFTGARDHDTVKRGAEKSRIECKFYSLGREQTASITSDGKKSALLNGIPLKSVTGLGEVFQAVVFSPSDLRLVSDGPSERREFADGVISSLYPGYQEKLKKYNRAVEQRNYVLKDYRNHRDLDFLLDDFEAQTVRFGSELIIYRKRFLKKLTEYCGDIYNGISSGKETFSAEYISTAGDSTAEFTEKLKASRESDCQTLTTSVGPHRDDIEILIDGISARKFGSQGQKRSAAITLKLASAGVTEEITGISPVILLDDVMSELDPCRQRYILNKIKDRQVFITCCDTDNIKDLEAGRIIRMRDGKAED